MSRFEMDKHVRVPVTWPSRHVPHLSQRVKGTQGSAAGVAGSIGAMRQERPVRRLVVSSLTSKNESSLLGSAMLCETIFEFEVGWIVRIDHVHVGLRL